MEATMKLAIETYSKLSGKTFENIVGECNSGNAIIIGSIQKLMFSAA